MKAIDTNNAGLIGQVYREVKDDVYAIFRSACIAEETCHDLVQDVFVKLMSIDLLEASRIKGLVITIAYRTRTDYIRHKAFINKKVKDVPAADCVGYENGYSAIEADELERIEMKVVGGMSKLDNQAYCMSRFEDKTTQEIAVILQLTPRAVESRLYRSRLQVRSRIAKAMNN